VNRSRVEGGDGIVQVCGSSEQQSARERPTIPGGPQQVQACPAGHPVVGHDDREFFAVKHRQGSRGVPASCDLERLLGQLAAQGGQDARFVVHQQQAIAHG